MRTELCAMLLRRKAGWPTEWENEMQTIRLCSLFAAHHLTVVNCLLTVRSGTTRALCRTMSKSHCGSVRHYTTPITSRWIVGPRCFQLPDHARHRAGCVSAYRCAGGDAGRSMVLA